MGPQPRDISLYESLGIDFEALFPFTPGGHGVDLGKWIFRHIFRGKGIVGQIFQGN